MIQKQVKIAGREVCMAYCYATEVAFREYAGEDLGEFISRLASGGSGAPDPQKVVYAIISSVLPYYQSRGEEPPVNDGTLLYECGPEELSQLLVEVLRLRASWYRIPAGEPEEVEGGEKNA